jgi:photosystem II stability/assembly factor-like uncharacterized protein
MKYDDSTNKWVKSGIFVADTTPAAQATAKGKKGVAKRPAPKAKSASQPLAFQVNDLLFAGNAWFAATSGGVLVSLDKGASWRGAGTDPFVKQPAQSLEASLDGSQVWAVSQLNLLYSSDGGKHWDAKEVTFASAGNLRVHRVDDANLYITSNMGLYVSHDAGRNWNRSEVRDLQFQDVAGSGKAILVALQKHGLLESLDSGKSWQRVNDPAAEGYFPVLQARRNGAVVAASATEGILTLEPGARSANESSGSSALAPGGGIQQPR